MVIWVIWEIWVIWVIWKIWVIWVSMVIMHKNDPVINPILPRECTKMGSPPDMVQESLLRLWTAEKQVGEKSYCRAGGKRVAKGPKCHMKTEKK